MKITWHDNGHARILSVTSRGRTAEAHFEINKIMESQEELEEQNIPELIKMIADMPIRKSGLPLGIHIHGCELIADTESFSDLEMIKVTLKELDE